MPGAFDAWMLLLRDYGTLPLAEVLGPAIAFARNGYPLVPAISATIERVRPLFERNGQARRRSICRAALCRNPAACSGTRRWPAPTRASWRRPGRGAAARRRSRRRANAWYKGFVAEAIDRFCRTQAVMDTSGRRHRGLLPGDDLAGWQATVEPPLTYDYHGFTLCKPGPWSQAPVALQQLALLEGFDLSALSAEDPEFVHLVTECAKLAFADREAFYGDPDFVEVPVATLLSDDYNAARRALVDARASRRTAAGRHRGLRWRDPAACPHRP